MVQIQSYHSFLPIDRSTTGTLTTGTLTTGQSGPESNGNEGVLQTTPEVTEPEFHHCINFSIISRIPLFRMCQCRQIDIF